MNSTVAGFMWECSCGHLERAEDNPEECPKCNEIGCFTKLPEEMVAEREKDLAMEDGNDY